MEIITQTRAIVTNVIEAIPKIFSQKMGCTKVQVCEQNQDENVYGYRDRLTKLFQEHSSLKLEEESASHIAFNSLFLNGSHPELAELAKHHEVTGKMKTLHS